MVVVVVVVGGKGGGGVRLLLQPGFEPASSVSILGPTRQPLVQADPHLLCDRLLVCIQGVEETIAMAYCTDKRNENTQAFKNKRFLISTRQNNVRIVGIRCL